jgi:hypothetical protein
MARREDEWVWGWDSTPGIVSVWADLDGRATVWHEFPRLENWSAKRRDSAPG